MHEATTEVVHRLHVLAETTELFSEKVQAPARVCCAAGRLNQYFQRELELLLTPIKLDPAHPFPYLPSGSLNLAVALEDPREQSGDPHFASHGVHSGGTASLAAARTTAAARLCAGAHRLCWQPPWRFCTQASLQCCPLCLPAILLRDDDGGQVAGA